MILLTPRIAFGNHKCSYNDIHNNNRNLAYLIFILKASSYIPLRVEIMKISKPFFGSLIKDDKIFDLKLISEKWINY